MHSQRPTATLDELLEIAARLRRFNDSKGIFLSGYRQIDGIVTGDLQEHTRVRPAFICLTGGMQKTRSEAKARCIVLAVPNSVTDVLQSRFVIGIHLDVRE